jgi:aspartyl-tRNA synthetase
LFEKTDEGYETMHNPFTAVRKDQEEAMLNGEVDNLIARGYDIVLNGSEIGGGSIRFSKEELQSKAFEILGLSEETIEDSFG